VLESVREFCRVRDNVSQRANERVGESEFSEFQGVRANRWRARTSECKVSKCERVRASASRQASESVIEF